MSLAFLVGEPKFQHVFALDTLAAGVTNILLPCRLYVAQRPGGYFLYKLVRGCASVIGIRFSPPCI